MTLQCRCGGDVWRVRRRWWERVLLIRWAGQCDVCQARYWHVFTRPVHAANP